MQLEPFYTTFGEKGPSAKKVVKEINDVEGPRKVNEWLTHNRFRCFKVSDTNVKGKPRKSSCGR